MGWGNTRWAGDTPIRWCSALPRSAGGGSGRELRFGEGTGGAVINLWVCKEIKGTTLQKAYFCQVSHHGFGGCSFLLLACFNDAVNSLLINFASDYFITSNSPFTVTLFEKRSPGSAATGMCVCLCFSAALRVCVCASLLLFVCHAKKREGVCPVFVCILTAKAFFLHCKRVSLALKTTLMVPFKLALCLKIQIFDFIRGEGSSGVQSSS